MASGLTKMLADYGAAPLLTYKQQILLGRDVRAWLDHPAPAPKPVERRGLRARDKLVKHNLRLVVSIASRYQRVVGHDSDRLQDLIQAGALGLQRAAEKYDPETGYRFSTYATWWVRQAVGRATVQFDAIRVPCSAMERWRSLCRLVYDYRQDHGHDPSLAWLAEQANLTVEQVRESLVIGRIRLVTSLDRRAQGDDSEAELIVDLIAAEGTTQAGIDARDEAQAQAQLLERLMEGLSERDKVHLQTFVNGERIRDIAAREGFSRQSGSLYRAAAVRRVQNRLASQDLDPAWAEGTGFEQWAQPAPPQRPWPKKGAAAAVAA